MPARGVDLTASDQTPGLTVRSLAVEALEAILARGVAFDEHAGNDATLETLAPRDRAFFMTLVMTALRRRGEADSVIKSFLATPLPRKSGRASLILLLGTVQLLFLGVAPHAAIDLSVRLARNDSGARHFAGLINAVLRKIATGGHSLLRDADAAQLNTPMWLWTKWCHAYGSPVTEAMAQAHGSEPPLDVTVKENSALWSERLGGLALPTGTVRLEPNQGMVDLLPGYSDGAWWIQDAAAAMPVKLLGDLSGKTVLDLCAAPGGKALQLCAAGADVTAVDISAIRLQRLAENLGRAGYRPKVIEGDAMRLDPQLQFDAVLLDAPCSATGTIRRHPDLPYRKTARQIDSLVALQRKMLEKSALHVKNGGTLLYCACSLEPEEGELQIERFLDDNPHFSAVPITPGESGIEGHFVSPAGYLRTLPHMPIGMSLTLDGFFAARLTRRN